MKVGIVGAGAVGAACLVSMALRGSASEIVLVNRNRQRAAGIVTDLQYGTLLGPALVLRTGDYDDLQHAAVVVLTAGTNEKNGGATDRNDTSGRLRLLSANATVYREIVPKIVAAAPGAILLVITDPPDALADVARQIAGHDRILSSGTFLDSLRFRFELGRRLAVSPNSIQAQVLGEHGTSQVFLWSTACVAGKAIIPSLVPRDTAADDFRRDVEKAVRYANITIIEGTGASQFGIGVVAARIVEIIARDERAVVPIGAYSNEYGVTLTLPARLGRDGISAIIMPTLSSEEDHRLGQSASVLRQALKTINA
jgi:L-lactate dehydrogenase